MTETTIYARIRVVLERVRGKPAAPAPSSAGVLIVCGLFLAIGVGVLDDYGVTGDAPTQRKIAKANVLYILGNDDALADVPKKDSDRFYGIVFELPLLAVEVVQRVLGLGSKRNIYLVRHLVTHLFFLAAGFFCYLLVLRLFGDRRLALFAVLLFLLSPRLYAHSFFNSKDVPFLSMFMIGLYLVRRAFDKDTVPAFVLCGVGVAALAGIRLPGVALLPAVLALRAVDFRCAAGRAERRHILHTGLAFAVAGALALYATCPVLWRDPVGALVEGIEVMAWHPTHVWNLFRGELIPSTEVPPQYVPTWFAITTPPVTLLLGLFGTGVVLHGCLARPGDVVRDTRLRFGVFLVCCFVLPVLWVIVLRTHLYGGWRQMYFLHVPFCLLAAFGVHRLAALPAVLRAGAYVLAGVGVGGVVIEMARLHPHQQVYFNLLVDRATPEHLLTRYDMDYWRVSDLRTLEYVLEQSSASPVSLRFYYGDLQGRQLLSKANRRRLSGSPGRDPDFYVIHPGWQWRPQWNVFPPVVHTRKVYNNTLVMVATPDLSLVDEATADRYREVYRSAKTGEPIIRAGFDVYLSGRTLTWIKEACRSGDLWPALFLSLRLADANDATLPPRWKHQGDGAVVGQPNLGVKFDGKCLASATLPDLDITAIRTGQREGGSVLWEAEYRFDDPDPLHGSGRIRPPRALSRRYRSALPIGRPGIHRRRKNAPFGRWMRTPQPSSP